MTPKLRVLNSWKNLQVLEKIFCLKTNSSSLFLLKKIFKTVHWDYSKINGAPAILALGDFVCS